MLRVPEHSHAPKRMDPASRRCVAATKSDEIRRRSLLSLSAEAVAVACALAAPRIDGAEIAGGGETRGEAIIRVDPRLKVSKVSKSTKSSGHE